MFVKQISVFLENTEGRLDEVLKILAQGGVDLLSVSLADTMEYGVLRLLAKDPDKAVGSLAKVVGMIHAAGLNISYIYGLSIDGDGAPIAIKTDDNAKAEALLNAAGVKTMGMEDLQ